MIVGHDDPAGVDVDGGVVDLRPGWDIDEPGDLRVRGARAVISGPSDLIELRQVVERMTGPASWPVCGLPDGFVVIETRRVVITLPRPAPMLGLVMAMGSLVDDRSRAWRTWKTVVESVGAGLGPSFDLTVEAIMVRSTR